MPSTSFSDDIRQGRSQFMVTALGTGAKLESYSSPTSAKPVGGVTASLTGCVKLETFTWPSGAIGTVTSVGLIDFYESAAVCVNTNNVNGTAHFIILRDSAGVIKAISDQFGGARSVTNGVTSVLSNLSLADGNP